MWLLMAGFLWYILALGGWYPSYPRWCITLEVTLETLHFMGLCTIHNGWALLRMSASEAAQGYSCGFLDSVSDDFCCKRCSLVARKLSITSCCGETYCHACITDTRQQGKPCPACGENEFSITQLIKFQKKLNEFLVYCSLKERGCAGQDH